MVIDTRVVEHNLAKLANYCREKNLKLRPHTKTHKSILMGKRQIVHGACGLTVAKVGEAEAMLNASKDLLLAYPALDSFRSKRIAELAREATIRVAIDSALAADVLNDVARSAGSTLGILVDQDVGFHRTGVQGTALALALAQHVSRKSNLRLDGLFFYNGHIKDSQTPQEHAEILKGISQMLRETIAAMKKSGLDVKIVSGGSTPTAYESHLLPEVTEIRPGTYIYSDFNCISGGRFSMEESAAQLICTVISDAVPGQIVIDSGSKTLTSDRLATDPENGGFGRLVDYPDARIVRLSEEHGEVDISKSHRKPKLGERVRVIPNHICPCINLQDVVWLKGEDGRVESSPVDARGKLV